MEDLLGGKIVEKCVGCEHVSGDTCSKWVSPEARFRVGKDVSCGSATHLQGFKKESDQKNRVGQQKQKRKK